MNVKKPLVIMAAVAGTFVLCPVSYTHLHADLIHGFLEDDAVFAAGDGFQVHADDFHAVLFQDCLLYTSLV